VNIKDNNFWSRQLLQSVEMGTNPAGILSYEKKVDALAPKDLKDVANKYLDTKNYVQVVLNPEK
jgi:zinc protease